ncbi:S1 family peptidase [Streptomyces sp. NRRL F-5630]|uniref:S1 family peptidase n=1 Tax=Streptomyces sp. NRRL F-5630 TaxID=1463864 RepID=UPI003EB78B14
MPYRTLGAVVAAVALTFAGTAAHAAPRPVVGGSAAAPGEYPWTVHLSMGCGGSLYAADLVLTAAHCLDGTVRPDQVTATLGTTDLDSPDALKVRGTKAVLAPGYDGSGKDWALLELAEPVDLPTLPLTPSKRYDKGTFTVAGWGATHEDGTEVRRLRGVHVPFVDDRTCARTYGKDLVPAEELCAGRPQGGADACQGDSGGPLFRPGPSREPVQIGIVSWGQGCGRAHTPGVYTELSHFREDIAKAAQTL